MTTGIKRTPLNDWHHSNGANMADFGGYDMPLWYPAGARAEHLAVVTSAGLFDTSHMAVVTLEGRDARGLLQYCFTRDLDPPPGSVPPLVPGRCVYGAFLNRDGGVIDDAIVYQTGAATYMVVVNAGMGAVVAAHLKDHADGEVGITDLSDKVGKIDLQGPEAGRILAPLLRNADAAFNRLPYFSFKGALPDRAAGTGKVLLEEGTSILLSRTGYTGEFGFELFLPSDRTRTVWERLLAAGAKTGLLPCGLAARDSLRTGAMLPLSHQDIGPWPFVDHPWPFALPWNGARTGFTKSFIGSDSLLAAAGHRFTFAFAGDNLRKVNAGEESRVTDEGGRHLGRVLTCVSDMAVGRAADGRIVSVASPDPPEGFKARGLCCGFIKVDRPLAPGDSVTLADLKREIRVTIVTDIRPDRTARRPLQQLLHQEERHERDQ